MTIPFPDAQSSDEALANAQYWAKMAELPGRYPEAIDKSRMWAQIALAMPLSDTVAVSHSDRALAIMRAIVAMTLSDSDHDGIFILTDRDLAVWSNRQMIVHEDIAMGLVRVRLDEP